MTVCVRCQATSGVQPRIQSLTPHAAYVHCDTHTLNWVLNDSCAVPELREITNSLMILVFTRRFFWKRAVKVVRSHWRLWANGWQRMNLDQRSLQEKWRPDRVRIQPARMSQKHNEAIQVSNKSVILVYNISVNVMLQMNDLESVSGYLNIMITEIAIQWSPEKVYTVYDQWQSETETFTG